METPHYYPNYFLLLNEKNPVLRFLGYLKLAILIFLLMMTTVVLSQAFEFYDKPFLQLETYLYKNKLYLNWSAESDKGMEYRNLIYVLEEEFPFIKIEYKTGKEGELNLLGVIERSPLVKEYNFSIWRSETTEKPENRSLPVSNTEEEDFVIFFRITTLNDDKSEINSVYIPFPIKSQERIINLPELSTEKELADIWYSEKK